MDLLTRGGGCHILVRSTGNGETPSFLAATLVVVLMLSADVSGKELRARRRVDALQSATDVFRDATVRQHLLQVGGRAGLKNAYALNSRESATRTFAVPVVQPICWIRCIVTTRKC
jgi:hypothetical protein